MASIEYAQKTTASTASSPKTISVKFTFPASSNNAPNLVQVTGTFNGWQRTEPLNLTQDKTRFERKVSIDWDHLQGQEDTDKNVDKNDMKLKNKKILFKFVLDNDEWVTDPDQARERDQAGNLNNVFVLEEPGCQIGAISTDRSDAQEHEQRANESCVPMVSETATGMEAEKKEEIDEQRVARLKEEEDDKVIRELGGGMWGTPYFAVNDPVDSSEHVIDSTVDKDEPMAEVEDATTMTMTPTKDKSQATIEIVDTNVHPVIVSESKADQKSELEDEDDDDKVIRELGGGMWGTPYFAVNDPMDLSENVADSIVDKDELMTEAEDALTTTDVETQITTVVADTIIHPALVAEPKTDQTNKADKKEENEDDKVIRELGGGMWGTPFFTVNDPAMLPEHFIEAIAATHPSAVIAIKSAAAATKSEDAGIVQDTVTTMDGPEDEADSLHVLTTSIKPLQPGEGALVEQLPETVVEPTITSETPAPSQSAVRSVLAEVGDAKPLIDASINIVSSLTNSPSNSMISTTSLPTNTTATSVNDSKVDVNGNMDSDGCKGDDEHHVVLLQNQSPVSPMSGDAKPTVDLSIATLPSTVSAPIAETTREALPGSEPQKVSASTSTVESSATDAVAQKTKKSERRKSLWKKIKKVLA
ncbi:hypothetical protein BG011_004143 [Mortierella polycephala]|uniref:AMP-activated protein kinase glycogen-binding domain-containing protein n=1 Tax=Mortierella polycephala TaxID=41804 RepID=A0A9P6U226_9FUNG|nr:hypothetical protein BG011_004143 [Mortierella polycephala]